MTNKYLWQPGILMIALALTACRLEENSSPIIPLEPGPVGTGPVTDIDSNRYDTVKIGPSVWLKQNLRVSKYRNGDPIPVLTDNPSWAKTKEGSCAFYRHDASNKLTYGRLYNWYAVADPRGLCPAGWHVPSYNEWNTLVNYLGGEEVAGGKLKSKGTRAEGDGLWDSPNDSATNAVGFDGHPGGYRDTGGMFFAKGGNAFWWSSTEYDSTKSYSQLLIFMQVYSRLNDDNKNYGYSLRCIRD